MYRYLLLILMLVGILIPTTSRATDISHRAVDNAVAATVSIEYFINGGWSITATGTAYRDPDFGPVIITARHVMEGIIDTEAQQVCSVKDIYDCVELTGVYLTSASDVQDTILEDWAIVPVMKFPTKVKPIELGNPKDLHLLDPLFMVGHPNRDITVSSAELSWLYQIEDNLVIETIGYGYFGSSGGGVFDRHGRLIGIISFIDSDPRRNVIIFSKIGCIGIDNIEILR